MSAEQEKRFALLIDADNISYKYIKDIIDELTNIGVITYKRIYGDWTKPSMDSWKRVLLEYSITPMQQYSYTTGKNATDSAMIIDAMDILYSGKIDGFCLASSDSDFTRLAVRLREAGLEVIGMGEQKTARPFITACSQFKYIDLLNQSKGMPENAITNNFVRTEEDGNQAGRANNDHTGAVAELAAPANRPSTSDTEHGSYVQTGESSLQQGEASSPTLIDEIKACLEGLIEQYSNDDGWMLLSALGLRLSKKYPDFDARNYGHKKLNTLLDEWGFELKSIKDINNKENPDATIYYVKTK